MSKQQTKTYRVVVIRPKDSVCGGDPAVDDAAAKKYAMMPTCMKITTRPPKDFRVLKLQAMRFFSRNRVNPAQYIVEERWSFPTYNEAEAKMFYEAKACGHFVRFRDTWVKL